MRPGDYGRLGPGLLGWRIPHRVVLGGLGVLFRAFRRGGGGEKVAVGEGIRMLGVVEGEEGQEHGAVVEVLNATVAVYEENASSPNGAQGELLSTVRTEGPAVRFHNVTAVLSLGSTLTKSYRALAELPRVFDGSDNPANAFSDSTSPLPSVVAPDPASENEAKEMEGGVTTPPPPAFLPPVSPPIRQQSPLLEPVVIKTNLPRQLLLAEDDIAAARKVLRRMTYKSEIDLDMSGVVTAVAAAVERARDMRSEAASIEKVRLNLDRAGMLGSAVGVPEVVSCLGLGPLARRGILVTTALRGVDVSDAYVMEHAAARGNKERNRFVDGIFAAFGQMCLVDGCFPSNPMPENLLYMYGGQVSMVEKYCKWSLFSLSMVSQLCQDEWRGSRKYTEACLRFQEIRWRVNNMLPQDVAETRQCVPSNSLMAVFLDAM